MNIELRRILVFLTGVAVCFAILDLGVGLMFDRLIKNMPPEGERVAKSYYSLNSVDADIIIVGSSRAETGYDCTILADSIPQFSFYNCGGDGQDFFYCNTLINTVLDRYTPKAVVWDFKEQQLGSDIPEDLSLIYPYYWQNPRIRKELDDMEGTAFKFLIRINSYRYNATAGRILRSTLSPKTSLQGSHGFGGLPVSINGASITADDFVIDGGLMDQKKVSAFIATAQRLKETGCKLFVVISPMYNEYNQDNFYTSETKKLCDDCGVVFLDDSHLPGFVHNDELSHDNYHLNIKGAQKFTGFLAGQLKNQV